MIQENHILEDINNVIYAEESIDRTKKRFKTMAAAFLAGTAVLSALGVTVTMLISGWLLLPVVMLGIILGLITKANVNSVATIVSISPKNADQLFDLFNAVEAIDGLTFNDKKEMFTDIMNKSRCVKKKNELIEKDEIDKSNELDCAKEVLDIFIKKIKTYDIDSSQKREVIQKAEKLKRELTIK